jgi:DNA-directed RNA polymerase beta subunit
MEAAQRGSSRSEARHARKSLNDAVANRKRPRDPQNLRWAIKTPVPAGPAGVGWGDLYLANEMNVSASKHSKQNTMKINDLLHTELFPHVGLTDKDNYAKACFLAHMTRKLLWVASSKIPIDDRDAYPNKRVDLPGFLLASLFRTYFNNKMVKDIRSSLSKEIHNGSWRASGNFEDIVNASNINKIIKSVIMEVGLNTSLATGNFGSAKIGGPTKN